MTKSEKSKRITNLARRIQRLKLRRERLEAEVELNLKMLPSNPPLN